MNGAKEQPYEPLDALRKPEAAKDLSRSIAQDALSIVIDAINSTVGGMIITDLDGVIRYANSSFCRMFQYSHQEIIGRNAIQLFSTKEVRRFSDVLAIIDISKDDIEEFVVENSDGEDFVVEISASNVTSASGRVVGRMASFTDITKRKQIEMDRETLITKLQDALRRIKTLRGIIPICASCKKIRDDAGYWNQVEIFIKEHSEAEFSHLVCPECAEKLYPELKRSEP